MDGIRGEVASGSLTYLQCCASRKYANKHMNTRAIKNFFLAYWRRTEWLHLNVTMFVLTWCLLTLAQLFQRHILSCDDVILIILMFFGRFGSVTFPRKWVGPSWCEMSKYSVHIKGASASDSLQFVKWREFNLGCSSFVRPRSIIYILCLRSQSHSPASLVWWKM